MYICIDDDKLLEKYEDIWTKIEDLWFKCARRWCRMRIFFSHFYCFFTCLWEQISSTRQLAINNIRQLCLQNCQNTNDRLS